MTSGNPRDASEGSAEGIDPPQDPLVERLRSDPAQPPEPTLTLAGFLGNSDRPGFRRLYFTRDLDYYAEFRVEDVAHIARIPTEEQPFRGEEATRVALRRDATFEYTWTRTARPLDEFDLDVRLARRESRLEPHFLTEGPADSCFDCPATPQTCAKPATCYPCPTEFGTCETCPDWPGCGPRVSP